MRISFFPFASALSVACSVPIEAGVTYMLVMLEGETQPGGAVFSDFQSAPGINQSGQILFGGSIGSSTEGLWVMSGSQLDALAIEDTDVPGIPDAKFNSFSSGLEGTFLADDGRVLFSSRIKGTGITTTNDLILWSGFPGALQAVMREGSPAPGAPGLNFVAPSTESFSFNPAILREGGVLGFIGQRSGAPVPLNDQRGAWTGTPGAIAPAILSGQSSPNGQIVTINSTELGLAPNGDAFVMAATGPGGRGLWRGSAGTLTRLYTQGQQVPGVEDTVFAVRETMGYGGISFFSPGSLSFFTDVDTSAGERAASFFGPTAAVNLSLLQGTSAPELSGPLLFLIYQAHANTHGGQVAGCRLQIGSGVTSANDDLLYYIPPGAAIAQWQLLAREGDPVPGSTNVFWGGGFFGDFIAINANGLVVFRNTLTGAGVTSNTDGCIWAWDAATSALTQVAREGTPIDFGGGNVHTPLILSFRGGSGRLAGRTSGLNDNNEIVFEALGSDFKEMISVATILADVRITSITRSGNTVTIQGSGVPSATHKLHATNDLLTPFSMNPIATTTADANGNFQFIDSSALARKFYRVAYP